MSRYIDADALKVSYCKQCLKETGNEQIEVKQAPYCAVACQDFDVINKQPTIDAVPVKWIENYMDSLGANGLLFNALIIEMLLRDYKKLADGERKDDMQNW